ncbi:phage baseplate upper protein [Enterococcus thailandicus]|uniref:phage baseplate upper protein n=1 Tax=Enterococcus thailandicus TaxID=417368 RepID=UPI0037508371
MANITHKITLSTTRDNYDVGVIKVRQADEETQIFDVQITENGVIKPFVGLTPFFCLMAREITGNGVSEEPVQVFNATSGTMKYTLSANSYQMIGRNEAYFSFRRENSDGEWIEQFSTRSFYYTVEKSIYTQLFRDSNNWFTFKELFRLFSDFLETGKGEWQDFVDGNKEILESMDPGGVLLSEVINARKPQTSTSFNVLGNRLDNTDLKIDGSRDVLLSSLDKVALLAKVGTREETGDTKFPQALAIDQEDGAFYIMRQSAAGGFDHTLCKYSLETNELMNRQVIPIQLEGYVEGLAWKKNAAGEMLFLLPTARQGGTYVLYNFEKNTVSDPFEMLGSNKLGMDNTGSFIVTIKTDEQGQDPNTYASGVYLYDYESVFNGGPVLLKTVDFMRDWIVSGYKIQAVTMVDDAILFAQGSNETMITAIDLDGLQIKRSSLKKSDYANVLEITSEVDDDTIMEPEGICSYESNGKTVIAQLVCTEGKACVVSHGISPDDSMVKVVSRPLQTKNPFVELLGYSILQSTRPNGSPKIDLSGTDKNLFETIQNLTTAGFYFIVTANTVKNTPYGASTLTGWVYIRSTSNGKASRAIVELTDNSNRKFAVNFDINRTPTWSDWEQTGGLAVTASSDISTLAGLTQAGTYSFSAALSRTIPDMPTKYVSLGTMIIHKPITSSFTIQEAYRLNGDTGHTLPANRILIDGVVAKGESTDANGWKYSNETNS